ISRYIGKLRESADRYSHASVPFPWELVNPYVQRGLKHLDYGRHVPVGISVAGQCGSNPLTGRELRCSPIHERRSREGNEKLAAPRHNFVSLDFSWSLAGSGGA